MKETPLNNKPIVDDFNRPWKLKSTDIEPLEKFCDKNIANYDLATGFSTKFELNSKFIDLVIYQKVLDTVVTFSVGESITLEITETTDLIKLDISYEDILYGAASFHPPFFSLLVNITTSFADTIIKDLSEMNNKQDYNTLDSKINTLFCLVSKK
jgi:hypothetical protein